MAEFPFVEHTGPGKLDHDTQCRIRSHAMLAHLRRQNIRSGGGLTSSGSIITGRKVLQSPGTQLVFQGRTASHKTTPENIPILYSNAAHASPFPSISAESSAPPWLRLGDSVWTIADATKYCGSYPQDGIPKELSKRAITSLQYRRFSHQCAYISYLLVC